MTTQQLKTPLRYLLAVAMTGIGVTHFAVPATFAAIVPRALPAPIALVYISGFFEVLGGLGLLVARTRRAAAWGLMALYVAVFPANVNMAVHHLVPAGVTIPSIALWLRLPLQLVLLAWAWWYTRPDAPRG